MSNQRGRDEVKASLLTFGIKKDKETGQLDIEIGLRPILHTVKHITLKDGRVVEVKTWKI